MARAAPKLQCSFTAQLPEATGGVSDYVTFLTSELRVVTQDGEQFFAGTAALALMNLVGARRAGFTPVEVLADEAQWGDYAALFANDRPRHFAAAVKRAGAGREDCDNLLIFDRVEVLPEYRGNDLALRYYNTALLRFGAGCSLAVLKPFPLQCESTCDEPASKEEWRQALRLSDFSRDRRAATLRLKRHYERCGFKALRGSPLMLLDLTEWQALLGQAE